MAMQAAITHLLRPISMQEVTALADTGLEYGSEYSLQQLLRSATLMRKHATIYEQERNLQTAYLLLYRHARLVVDFLPQHPHAKAGLLKKDFAEARRNVALDLKKMEQLKPIITEQHQRYLERIQASCADVAVPEEPCNGGTISSPNLADTDKHADMEVQFANDEMTLRTQRSAGCDSMEIYDSRDLPTQPVETRRRIEQATKLGPLGKASGDRQTLAPRDPKIYRREIDSPSSANVPSASQVRSSSLPSFSLHNQGGPPQPKNISQRHSSVQQSKPPVPQKLALDRALQDPFVGPSFRRTSSLESGGLLRTVLLPENLQHEFLTIAAENTAHDLETCGFLCGTLIRNAFFISRLVIPEQTSTSDTCEMVNEEALHNYVASVSDTEELMVLGWIHTHPTQTCFLSSRDLHTHVWYQALLPEFIAIVCAPSQRAPGDFAVFRLTDPPGMQIVRTCTQPGTFHSHEDASGGIFTDALGRPGHVISYAGLKYEVVDLRPGQQTRHLI